MNDGDQIAALSVSENGDLPGRLWAFDEFSTNEDSSTADLATGLISLGFIRAALRRRAWLWCAAAAIGLLAGLGLFIKVPPAYQASTSLLITNNPDEQAGDAALDNQAIAQSRTVAGDALRALGLRQSVTKFIGDYTVTVVTNRVLLITVKATSSEAAVREANALASAFLTFQANQLQTEDQLVGASLQQQITQAQQNINAISKQIYQLSVQPASPVQQAQLRSLRTESTQANAALTALRQANLINQATMQENAIMVVKGSRVLDPAAPIPKSRLKLRVIYAVTGLIAGLALGVGIVVLQALVSDRLRRRDDVAHALGAPVKLSVGKVRLSRWPFRRGLQAASGADIGRIVKHLADVAAGNLHRPPALAVVPVDNPQVAALSLVSLAVTSAQQGGMQVVLADLCSGTPAAQLLGATDPGVHTVSVNDTDLVVVVPQPDDVVPAGPLSPLAVANEALAAAYASADLLLTLAPLDPSLGADHLATWATGVVAVVTAGQCSEMRIHAVGEMIRLAGLPLISAVLVGADKTDESLGVADSSSPADSVGLGLGR